MQAKIVGWSDQSSYKNDPRERSRLASLTVHCPPLRRRNKLQVDTKDEEVYLAGSISNSPATGQGQDGTM